MCLIYVITVRDSSSNGETDTYKLIRIYIILHDRSTNPIKPIANILSVEQQLSIHTTSSFSRAEYSVVYRKFSAYRPWEAKAETPLLHLFLHPAYSGSFLISGWARDHIPNINKAHYKNTLAAQVEYFKIHVASGAFTIRSSKSQFWLNRPALQ